MQLHSKFKVFGLLSLLLVFFTACTSDSTDEVPIPDTKEIWTGANITFEKADDGDPDLETNQDRITDNVWITRGTEGGQIFNIKVEDSSSKSDSPTGTLWAIGTVDEIDDLDFQPFRTAIKPKEVVGKDLIVFLREDNVFISLKFTKWSSNKGGGFAYERSSE